jgi:hypothetical protein
MYYAEFQYIQPLADKRLTTNARFWALALGCRVDPAPVREIQGCTPK